MKPIVVALLGNPNCGKTTLFNALTGGNQRVGNWSGVTVDKKRGCCRKSNVPLEFVDLPGCVDLPDYIDHPRQSPIELSVSPLNNIPAVTKNIPDIPIEVQTEAFLEIPIDEQITHDYLATQDASIIVNVIDATQLERHLYLTLRLLEEAKRQNSHRPVIIALNMMDAARKLGIEIDHHALAKALHCPVVPIIATQKETTEVLKAVILDKACEMKTMKKPSILGVSAISNSEKAFSNSENASNFNTRSDVALAKERYHKIRQLLKEVLSTATKHTGEEQGEQKGRREKEKKERSYFEVTEKFDSIMLHRYLGIPIFLFLMYLVFVLTIQVGGGLQDGLDEILQTVCIDWVNQVFTAMAVPQWLLYLMVHGVGQGFMTTLSFIPVITCMFFCLSILEASGYMARVAFVMDKLMQWVGLSGKSFVPMILGFGCNVPAILGARTLENHRERILTILMSPFMSCGARLAIFALFVSVFFKEQGHNIIFALYLIGILVALLTGLALRSSVMAGEKTALVMELPPYRWPNFKRIWQTTWFRLHRFLLKAGIIIVPLCTLFSLLSVIKTEGQEPWLSYIGRAATPIFAPMGIEKDNWPATVGLLTGVLAKEVVVGTLTSLYANDLPDLVGVSPVGDSLEAGDATDPAVLTVMAERFGGIANAFAYLLFVLLYFPCVSVLASITRELNAKWALLSGVWTTSIAYIVAVFFYQGATFLKHPYSSLLWILGMVVVLIIGLWGMRKWVNSNMRTQKVRFKKPLPTQILVLNT